MKTKLIKVLLVCSLALSLCPLAFATDELPVILQKPVKVMTKDIDGSEENHYQLELSIEHNGDRYKFHTNIMHITSYNGAIQYQRKRTHWQGHYLFVGWERGGGNASRGYLDTVFMLKKGKLLFLGEVDADSFENGVFKDWYDKFELNELTSHAESPLIRLVLEEKGGRLMVNLDKTWNENQKRFNDNRAIINDILGDKKMNSESKVTWLSGPLLFNAVLGKYCKRQADIESFLKIADKNLDRKTMKIFNEILTDVVPGAVPKSAVKVDKH